MGTKSELVDGKESAILFKDEVYAIIGAAFDVYKELGSGFLEAVYHEAMEIELAGRSIPFVSRTRLHVRFKDQILKKEYEADFICYDAVLVEIKAEKTLTSADESQILNYLKATGLRLGVLINFGSFPLMEWKRLIK